MTSVMTRHRNVSNFTIFTIKVQIIGITNGKSKFLATKVLDKLGGNPISGAIAYGSINVINVGPPGDMLPDEINNVPNCLNDNLSCNSGLPTCLTGDIPICGSAFGLSGDLAGPGCADKLFSFFENDDSYCSTQIMTFSQEVETCEKTSLCPSHRKRFALCREDKVFCKCVCPFKFKRDIPTARCYDDEPTCPGTLEPKCLQDGNSPICVDGKLLCGDEGGFVDLIDTVSCK